jgi:hypothetical protein
VDTQTYERLKSERTGRMRRGIIEDVMEGLVPLDVANFSELHDYVDANCYGGFCDDGDCDDLIKQFGGRGVNEGMPDSFIEFMSDCQNDVGEWIKAGHLLRIEDQSWEDFTPMRHAELLRKQHKLTRALEDAISQLEQIAFGIQNGKLRDLCKTLGANR